MLAPSFVMLHVIKHLPGLAVIYPPNHIDLDFLCTYNNYTCARFFVLNTSVLPAHGLHCRALRKAMDVYQQLEGHMQSLQLPMKSCGSDPVPIQRALVAGLFPHAAKRQPDGTYRVIATGQIVHLHPSSVLKGKAPEMVVFSELVRTTKQYARVICRIQARWLPELAPAFFAAKAGAGVAAESAGTGAAVRRGL